MVKYHLFLYVYLWLLLIFADAAFLCVGYAVTIFFDFFLKQVKMTHLGWVTFGICVDACVAAMPSPQSWNPVSWHVPVILSTPPVIIQLRAATQVGRID